MTEGGEGGGAWTLVATIVEAAAVVGATVLAAIALRKQSSDEEARRKSTDASIGADAYLVRRTLRGWILAGQHLLSVGGSLTSVPVAGEDHDVEERLQRAIAGAPHASAPVGTAIREAYALYYQATGQRPVTGLADLQA